MIDVCVIGGGAAGMAAAISAYKNGAKKVTLIERDKELGGILLQCIHNGFGLHYFKEELTGPDYAERFKEEIKKHNIKVLLNTTVINITKNKEIHYMNEDCYKVIKAKAIIVTVGCRERNRHAIDIPGSRCAGIYTAGLAQRYLNIEGYLVGKRVFILGSGDIGLIMARRMTLEGATVVGVAEIMPYSNGLNRNIAQCLEDYNIPLYLSHTVTNIYGKDRLEKITISQVDNSLNVITGTEKEFEVDTLLLSIGLIPENNLLKGADVRINKVTNGALVDEHYQTNIKGIFACGNALHVHDLVDNVTIEGLDTGKYAALYSSDKLNKDCNIEVKPADNVRYTVPNYISNLNINIKFRVTKPILKGNILVKINDNIIKEVKKNFLLPAEMETINITSDLELNNNDIVTIEVRE